MTLNPLVDLGDGALRALAASLRSGTLSAGVTALGVRNALASSNERVEDLFAELTFGGTSPISLALIVEGILLDRERRRQASILYELVLSGPEVPGVPTSDTAATMRSLIETAEHSVVLVGYAIYNGRKLFERLAHRVVENALDVTFCLEISRPYQDTSLSEDIVNRFAERFGDNHWPWPVRPKIYYDPRSVEHPNPTRSSLHAKCIVADRNVALLSSANFTEAALHRNIEAGVLVKDGAFVHRLDGYFQGLISNGTLARLPGW